MPELQTNIMGNLFKISTTELGNAYEAMVKDLGLEIANYQATGMNGDAIYKALLADIENNASVFGRFNGDVERAMDGLMVRTTQSEQVANNLPEQMYEWILDPTVQEHCGDCLSRSEMPAKPFFEWSELGIPGSGVTECGDYCKCLLEVVSE
jgi:hypothetical protein